MFTSKIALNADFFWGIDGFPLNFDKFYDKYTQKLSSNIRKKHVLMYYDQEPLCQSNHFCSCAAANFVLKDPVVILNALSIYPRGSSIKHVDHFLDSLTPPPSPLGTKIVHSGWYYNEMCSLHLLQEILHWKKSGFRENPD